jgi:hypothetical protein
MFDKPTILNKPAQTCDSEFSKFVAKRYAFARSRQGLCTHPEQEKHTAE